MVPKLCTTEKHKAVPCSLFLSVFLGAAILNHMTSHMIQDDGIQETQVMVAPLKQGTMNIVKFGNRWPTKLMQNNDTIEFLTENSDAQNKF